MELNNIIPDNKTGWSVNNDILYFYKYQNLPIAFIRNEIAYVILDLRVKRAVTSLIKSLVNKEIEFYLITPEYSIFNSVVLNFIEDDQQEGSIRDEFTYQNTLNYLWSLTKDEWIDEFERIEFNLIENLIKFTNKYNCYSLVPEIIEKLKLRVFNKYYDPYTKDYKYNFTEKVRNIFTRLFRDIQLSKILN